MSHNFAHGGRIESGTVKENETSGGKVKLSFWFKPTKGEKLYCIAYSGAALNLKWHIDKELIYITGFVNENKENIVTSVSVEDRNEQAKVVESLAKLYSSEAEMKELRCEEAEQMGEKGFVRLMRKIPCGLYGYSYIPVSAAIFYLNDPEFVVEYPKKPRAVSE